MPLNYYKPLSISKTPSQWEVINKKILASGKKNMNCFLRAKIKELKKSFDECPPCYSHKKEEKKEKRPYVSIDQYEIIRRMAKKMKVHPSVVVDIFIIDPLLNSEQP